MVAATERVAFGSTRLFDVGLVTWDTALPERFSFVKLLMFVDSMPGIQTFAMS